MTNNSFDSLLSDDALLEELGDRLTRARLDREWTQAELAEASGVSKRTVERLEAGQPTQIVSFLRVLRAMEMLANLEEVLPRPGLRPMELLKLQGDQRKRAPRKKEGDDTEWSWGEE